MKKLLLLFSLIIITSCSSSDDDNSGKTNNSGDSFNPPAWLVGTWKDTGNIVTYTFTNDDIICTAGGHRLSFKDQATELKNAKGTYSIKETKIDDNYTAEFKTSAGTTILSFTKVSDTRMTSDGYLDGTYIKQ
jgi:hypothetical protein